MVLNFIQWDVSPEIFHIGGISIRYYGLLFASTFLAGLYILERIYKAENVPEKWLDKIFLYVLIGTVIGARLGHVVFYGWDYYSQHPAEILQIWQGGLASHGGAIGIIIAVWLYSKYVTKLPMLWTFDRMVITVALGGLFIRTGNLMNSEIIGMPTTMPWGFVFTAVDNIPRHPTQIYEALCYLTIFFTIFYMYWKTNAKEKQGLIFGVFLIGVFTARFFIEFIKEDQEAFEKGMLLNMGQILSIPFILGGIWFVYKALKK